jgi:hypothetical protein
MRCPKCQQENPAGTRFCKRCHTPLTYTCPSCKHVQEHGGTCDKCGVDFAKYATLLMFQVKDEAAKERERARTRASLAKQLVLLPITGGISLVKYLLSLLRGD